MKYKKNTQEPSGSGTRGRSGSSERRTRGRSGSSERRTQRSPERRRTSGTPERRRTRRTSSDMPKYLYQIDMPEDLREALRVSNFIYFYNLITNNIYLFYK